MVLNILRRAWERCVFPTYPDNSAMMYKYENGCDLRPLKRMPHLSKAVTPAVAYSPTLATCEDPTAGHCAARARTAGAESSDSAKWMASPPSTLRRARANCDGRAS